MSVQESDLISKTMLEVLRHNKGHYERAMGVATLLTYKGFSIDGNYEELAEELNNLRGQTETENDKNIVDNALRNVDMQKTLHEGHAILYGGRDPNEVACRRQDEQLAA